MGRPRKEKPRDPWAVKIGQRLQKAREQKKWTLKAMSAFMGGEYSEQRIGNYETGDRTPGPGEVLRLADVLGEAPAYLMGLVDDTEPQAVRNSEEAALLELYRTVDPTDRKKTIDRLGAMALLKKEGVEDAKLQHLSAKGKATTATGSAARTRSNRRRSETERGG